jgi:hypothetical protein
VEQAIAAGREDFLFNQHSNWRIFHMRKAKTIIACLTALVVLVIVQSAAAQGNRLQGVWKTTELSMSGPNAFKNSNPQPDLWIFAKTHYCSAAITSEKPRPNQPVEKATDAQKLAIWDAFDADAGTYEVKGTTLIMQAVVAKDPEDMQPGKPHIFDFKIEGNTLLLTLKVNQDGPLPNPLQFKLTRVE